MKRLFQYVNFFGVKTLRFCYDGRQQDEKRDGSAHAQRMASAGPDMFAAGRVET